MNNNEDLKDRIPVQLDSKTTIWVRKGKNIKKVLETYRNRPVSNAPLNYFN